jgi:hypothetical protein
MRESVAMGESLTGHVRSEDNPADICTKVIGGGVIRERLTAMILFFANTMSVVASASVNRVRQVGKWMKRSKS